MAALSLARLSHIFHGVHYFDMDEVYMQLSMLCESSENFCY